MREYRDYWGPSEGAGGFRLGFGFTTAVKAIMIVEIALFVLLAILDKLEILDRTWQYKYLALSGDGAINHFYVWQFLTYMLLHDPSSIFHILFNMLFLYFFGPLIEQHYGSRKFLYMFVGGGILGGLAFTVVNYFQSQYTDVVGASGAIMAIVIAAAMLFPNITVWFFFFIPMRLRTVAIIYVAMDLYTVLFVQESTVAATAHLGGALFGFLFVRYERSLTNWFFQWERKLAAREKKSTLKTRQRVDELLDKISREGITSLTSSEKKFLKRASQEYKDDGI